MAKREFLMLAHKYKPKKYGVGGWFLSEKLDGMRAYWDGGVSRGMLKSEVPWANTDKDDRYIVSPTATGLWSRYGNVIHAPDWWLDKLPAIPLDGELYIHEARQNLMSIVKDTVPGRGWAQVTYRVFDMPAYETVFDDGKINNINYKKTFKDVMTWIRSTSGYDEVIHKPKPLTRFETTYKLMKQFFYYHNTLISNPVAVAHTQVQLPFGTEDAQDMIDGTLMDVTRAGGEGLILRHTTGIWYPERSHNLLKVKQRDDMEGVVRGYVTGRATELGSKLRGLMGAMILELPNGKRMELSGFTDEERELTLRDVEWPEEILEIYNRLHGWEQGMDNLKDRLAWQWAYDHPETEVPKCIEAKAFPRGTEVSFKYRGKTEDGIPQEAAYWRKRNGK